jgi:enoyl-CoA hydratase/carnithine racemase
MPAAAQTPAPVEAAPDRRDEILHEVRDNIGLVTFNRPQARNALTFHMYDRLAEICRTVPEDGSVRAIIVTGAGDKAFAAGTDISLFRAFKSPEQGLDYEAKADVQFSAIESCPVPLIAAIAGACTGGGAGIAACCDIRIATRDMRYGFPIARTLGNMLSAATLARLAAHFGHARLKHLLYTSRLMQAEEARTIGFVAEVLESHDELMSRAWELAREIAGNAPLTIRATKELLGRIARERPRIDDHDWVAKVYTSDDFKEGMDAFLNKRKPQWTGK